MLVVVYLLLDLVGDWGLKPEPVLYSNLYQANKDCEDRQYAEKAEDDAIERGCVQILPNSMLFVIYFIEIKIKIGELLN